MKFLNRFQNKYTFWNEVETTAFFFYSLKTRKTDRKTRSREKGTKIARTQQYMC
jgi:hypothetical protein